MLPAIHRVPPLSAATLNTSAAHHHYRHATTLHSPRVPSRIPESSATHNWRFFQQGHPKFGLEILFLIVHSGFEEVGLLRKWTHTLTHTHRQRVPHCLDALLLREVAGLTPRSFPQRSCRPLPLIHPSPWSSLWGRKNLTTFKRIITRF